MVPDRGKLPGLRWSDLPGMVGRQGRRVAKRWRQLRRYGAGCETTPVFILGCQRSGSTMLLKTLGRSPEVWAHGHRRADAAYGFRPDPAYLLADGGMPRLQPPESLRPLLARAHAPVVVIHALAESQRADRLLAEHPGCRLLWIYRRYQDVANSAIELWGDHHLELVRWLQERDWENLRWRGDRVGQPMLEVIDRFDADRLSRHDASALVWWMRNRWFFELGLEGSERILLVRYEELVSEPVERFGELYGFLGAAFEPRFVEHIHSGSIGKQPWPGVQPDIAELCDGLLAELDRARTHPARTARPGP